MVAWQLKNEIIITQIRPNTQSISFKIPRKPKPARLVGIV
ncbi:hypothetical protein SAMN06265367_101426 [Algoriphagus winogradskyi]|uniref:Uncharacterized protein n=1 Tax=Algoriphagus winogradskyi TaxID=237017 RepID=A0ABY1NC39_9BACT|nr:hypothetical protein SAMN06265367_101426 [Algoriphagus winogradskyi]